MSIYGGRSNSQNKVDKTLEMYIEESFLDSIYNENVSAIHDKIIYHNESSQSTFDFIKSIISESEEKGLSENSKDFITRRLLESMGVSYDIVEAVTEDAIPLDESTEAILEFQGNPEKNKEFISILKDLEDLCNYNYERIKRLADDMDKLDKDADEAIKDPKKFKEILERARQYIQDFNEWYRKASKTINAPVTFKNFQSKIKKFNNKYSEITMDEKKKLRDKLLKIAKDIDAMIEPWAKGGKRIDAFKEKLTKLSVIDKDYFDKFNKYAWDNYDYFFSEYKYTFDDIAIICKYLNIERENTVMYKIVNKLFK